MISIIMQGKNDNYLENFLQRLTLSISKHIDNIKTLGLENQVQIVLTDWGSETKLIDILDVDFSFIKYIYVKPEIANKYNGDTKYSYVHPLNVSARNADGEFIVWGDSDGFLPLESFKRLYELITEMKLNNKYDTFYWGSRYHIPRENYTDKNIDEIEKIIITNQFKHDKIDCANFGGGASILLLTKEMYFQTTGMWENLIYWGWQDIEFHRRLLKKYEFGGDLEDIGIKIYHLEHWENREQGLSYFKWNEEIESDIIQANQNWGLKDESLEITKESSLNKKIKLLTMRSLDDGLNDLAKIVKINLGDNLKIVEIGSYQGESTEIIAKNFPNSEINAVDIWEQYIEDVNGDGTLNYTLEAQQLELEEAEIRFTERIQNFSNIKKNKISSLDFSKKIENNSIDFVYIDGNHQYSSVKEDILSWLPKIKKSGIISGHDYGWNSVQKALSECFGKEPDITFKDSSWLYFKKDMKLKLVHILNKLDGDREINSINSLSTLKNLGIEYIQQVTPLYEGDDWKIKPITNMPGNNNHGKGHYGNYLSFMKAIKENFTEDLDALILCECDCILNIPQENFLNEMRKTLEFSKKHHIYHFSWGGRIINGIENGEVLKYDEEYPNYCVVGKIILAHFIILTKESREFFLRKVDSMGWDVADIWFNETIFSAESDGLFSGPGRQANVLNSLAYQYEGVSLIDGVVKGEKSTDTYDIITYNFNNNAGHVEILGDSNKIYKVQFLFNKDIIYESKIKSNNWAAASSEVNHIKIFDENNLLIYEKLKTKNIISNKEYSDFQSIYKAMIEKFSDDSHFVEIGDIELGKSAKSIGLEISNSKKNIKFEIIDTWKDSVEWYNINGLDMSPYQAFLENTRPFKQHIKPIIGNSYDIVSDYADNSIDFLFINNKYDYESLKKDIYDWYPKIKFNGMIGGHNFVNTISAVNEFFGSTINTTPVWLISKEEFEKSKRK